MHSVNYFRHDFISVPGDLVKIDRKLRLEKIAKLLMNSPFIQRLSRRYPVEIFPDKEDGFVLRVELCDRGGKLVDVFDIPANLELLVDYDVVLHFIILAFEVGLEYDVWKAAGERIRKMKF